MPEINWQIMLSQAITFLIAVTVVWALGWKPLLKFIRDRQEKIKQALENAESTRVAITKLETDYRAKLEQVERKSSDLIALARQEANRAKDEIMKSAQTEAAEMRKKSHEQLEQDRKQLMAEMRSEIIGLSMAIAEKALQEPLPGSAQDKRFQEILEELSKGQRRPS